MSLEAGAAVVVLKSELSDEPGWIFAARATTSVATCRAPTCCATARQRRNLWTANVWWTSGPRSRRSRATPTGAADEARAFLEQARARRGVRDVFREEEPKKRPPTPARPRREIEDAVQQLANDTESAPSAAAAVEGIDDDAEFTRHIADEANASEDEIRPGTRRTASRATSTTPWTRARLGTRPRGSVRSGPGLGDGDVASPPARNDDDDGSRRRSHNKKPAPKEVAELPEVRRGL